MRHFSIQNCENLERGIGQSYLPVCNNLKTYVLERRTCDNDRYKVKNPINHKTLVGKLYVIFLLYSQSEKLVRSFLEFFQLIATECLLISCLGLEV